MVNRGDVAWLEHPDAGRRPALVLTRQAALPRLTHVLVALVSRTVRGIPTEVELGTEDGMPVACAVSLDNLMTVPGSMLTDTITSLDGVRMHQVCHALAVATDCRA